MRSFRKVLKKSTFSSSLFRRPRYRLELEKKQLSVLPYFDTQNQNQSKFVNAFSSSLFRQVEKDEDEEDIAFSSSLFRPLRRLLIRVVTGFQFFLISTNEVLLYLPFDPSFSSSLFRH